MYKLNNDLKNRLVTSCAELGHKTKPTACYRWQLVTNPGWAAGYNHRWAAGYKPWMGSWLQILDGQLVTNPRWTAGYKLSMGSWLQTIAGQLVTTIQPGSFYNSLGRFITAWVVFITAWVNMT